MKKANVRASLTYRFTMEIPDDQSFWDTIMDSIEQDPYWNTLKQVLGRDWVSAETVDIIDEDTGETIWPQNLW